MYRLLCISFVVAFCISCGSSKKSASGPFGDYIYDSLALAPVSATGNGYHTHKGIALDEALDDFSPQGMQAQRKFVEEWQGRIASITSA